MNEKQRLENLIINELVEFYDRSNRHWKMQIGKIDKDIKTTKKQFEKYKLEIEFKKEVTEDDATYVTIATMYSLFNHKDDIINENSLNFVTILSGILNRTKWDSELAKSLFFNALIDKTNMNDREDQQLIRKELSNLKITGVDLFQYFRGYESLQTDFKYLQKIQLSTGLSILDTCKNDVEYLTNNEYITVYRGFNTRQKKRVRKSSDKNNKDYYKQLDGSGFSFTLDKYVAFSFSYMWQLHNYHKLNYEKHRHIDKVYLNKNRKLLHEKYAKIIGHATIGRYLVKRSDISFYTNGKSEREVILNDRKAKLINYKLLSDEYTTITLDKNKGDKNLLGDKKTENFPEQNMIYYKKHKNLWINKNWNTEIKISNKLKSLFN